MRLSFLLHCQIRSTSVGLKHHNWANFSVQSLASNHSENYMKVKANYSLNKRKIIREVNVKIENSTQFNCSSVSYILCIFKLYFSHVPSCVTYLRSVGQKTVLV